MEKQRKPPIDQATSQPYRHGVLYVGQPLLYPIPPQFRYQDDDNIVILRRMIIISVFVFVVFLLASSALWLFYRPHLPLFAVSSAAVSSFNISNDGLVSGNFNLSVSIRNPNLKLGLSYDSIEAMVLYRSQELFETSLTPFYQEKGNSTVLVASFQAVAKHVDDHISHGIARGRASNGGILDFQVGFLAWVKFRLGRLETSKHLVRVDCDFIRVRLSDSLLAGGFLVGSPAPCVSHL
ncbi:NDR1/HIN1-like protein 10 [Wolffia australiana]